MAMATKSRSPWATAEKSATRSAQQVGLKLADSTLQPLYTLPSPVRRAAPT